VKEEKLEFQEKLNFFITRLWQNITTVHAFKEKFNFARVFVFINTKLF